MTKTIRNQKRADTAQLALDAYSRANETCGLPAHLCHEEAMIDLLTDLRHWSARHKVDFARVIRISEYHFSEEADSSASQLPDRKA